jgi:hypothetical protein
LSAPPNDEGWEWPLLLFILDRFPDDFVGERQAVNLWAAIVRSYEQTKGDQ